MNDNVKLDIAIELIATKIAIAMEKKEDDELKKLLEEREKLYLGDWNIINKVLNDYSEDVKL